MPLRPRAVRRSLAITAALALSMLAAGCGSAASTSPASGSSAATGVSGTLNWEWELPTSWDPVTSTAGWDVHVLGLVYASVTSLDPAGNVVPGLATSWTYAPDGKSVTFTLRPGLTFTDGTPLNAQAVQENIERGQKQANSTIASELSVISKVVVNSPTSFTLDLAQVDYQVPYLLAGKDGMMVSPAVFTKDAGSLPTHPIGAGPFKLASYVPDSHANLVRSPGYWDASQIHLANFTVQDITQPEQILAALQSGQVNVAYIAGNQVAAAKAAGFKIAVIPSEVVNELDIQTTTKPFDNPDVVKAINYAIDRQAILQVQASGYGSVSYQPFPKGFVGYNASLANLYPYDPAKARQLLAAAGYPNGLKITLTAVSTEDSLAEQVQGQLKQVGITATITNVPVEHRDPVPLPRQDHPVCRGRHGGTHVPGRDARRPLQPAGPDERGRQGDDRPGRGEPGAGAGPHRAAHLAQLPERPAERHRHRGAGRPHPHLALHQPAHLRLQPEGHRHPRRPGPAALGRRPGGELTMLTPHSAACPTRPPR